MIAQMTPTLPQIFPVVYGVQSNKCRDYSFHVVTYEGRDQILWIRADITFHLYEIIRRIEREFSPAEIKAVRMRGIIKMVMVKGKEKPLPFPWHYLDGNRK